MTVVYGLLGLSIIIFIHETGHFIAARFFGVQVESFSIGMGPVLLHKCFKGTDYRISLIPFGGYCGMKGEKDFHKAMEEKLDYIPAEKDSFYGIHPLKRLCIAFAGPFANFLSALTALSLIAMIGYDYYTTSNKIVLAEELQPEKTGQKLYPASRAGLQTGDVITAVNGKSVTYFSDIAEMIALSAEKEIYIEAERGGSTLNVTVVPELDKSSGAGKIGILSWTPPLIDAVADNSPAKKAGLQAGDLITEANGKIVRNTIDLYTTLQNLMQAAVVYERGGVLHKTLLTADQDADKSGGATAAVLTAGINWHIEKVRSKTYSFFPAFVQGAKESITMLGVTVKGIGLLFKGIDVKQAVSGPIGITMMLGESAKAGFSESFTAGLVTVLNFLAVISLSLFLMNLLPIPVLDGGLIVYSLIESVRGKAIRPQTLYRIQFIGIAFIVIVFAFGMFNDISKILQRIGG